MAETAKIELQLERAEKLKKDLDEILKRIKGLESSLRKLEGVRGTTLPGIKEGSARLRALEKEARRAKAALERLANAGKRVGGLARSFRQLRGALVGLGILAVVRRMTRLVTAAIDVKRAFDGIEQTLKAVTDSTEEYNQAQTLVFSTAKRLGLQITALGTDYANFLASTKELDLSQREIEKVFVQVAEAARVLNLPVDRVKLTFLALSQTASKGIATMEELRRQLGDQLPGILPRLAKELGLTTAQLFEMIRAGDLLAEEALPAIGRAAEKLAGGQVLEASQTLAANIERLGTASQLAQKRIIELAEPALNKLIAALTKTAESSPELEESLANIVKSLVALGEAGLTIAPGLIKITEILANVGDAINIITQSAQAAVESDFKLLAGLFGSEADFERVIILAEETADAITSINEKLLKAQGKSVDDAIDLADKEATEREKIAKISAKALARIAERLGKDLSSIAEDAADRIKNIEKLTAKEREEILKALVRELARIEIEAAEDRAAAADAVVLVARGVADERLRTNEALAARLAALELQVVSDFQAAAEELLAAARLTAKEREKLAEALAEKLLKIEQNRIEKIEDARAEFEESIKEGTGREDAEKELSEKVVQIFEDETKKKIDLLESFTDQVEKSVEKQIKLDEKLLKKRLESLEKLRVRARGVFKELEDLSFGDGGEEAGESFRNLSRELEALQAKRVTGPLSAEDSLRLQQLPRLIAEAGENLQRFGTDTQIAAAGIDDLGIGMAQFSDTALEKIRGLVVGNKDFAASFQALGVDAQAALGGALRDFEQLAANNRATDADVRALEETFRSFGLIGSESIGSIGSALDSLSGASTPAQQIAADLTNIGDQATAAEPLVAGLASKIAEVGNEETAAKVRGLASSFTTLGQILSEQETGLSQLSVFADALTRLATPLEVIATNLPALPEPVAALVASAIELVEAKALEPLTASLVAIVEPVGSLAESLPLVATATGDLVEAADGSEESLKGLRAALEGIGSKEVASGLETAAAAVSTLQEKLEALAGAEGFKATQDAAEELAAFLGDPFEAALLQMQTAIGRAQVDLELFRSVISSIKSDAAELSKELSVKLPAAAESGAKRAVAAIRTIRTELRGAVGDVQLLIDKLEELEAKRDAA